nr:hypothetical protein [Acidobacteriota bacterium]
PEVAPNGRLEAISCREPAVFLARVLSGAVGAAAVESACGAPEPCPALRADLADGSVVLLVVDRETHMPRSMKTWWAGKEDTRTPDEQVRYEAWRRVGGVQLAAVMTVEDALGAVRRFRLRDWVWELGPTAPGSRAG